VNNSTDISDNNNNTLIITYFSTVMVNCLTLNCHIYICDNKARQLTGNTVTGVEPQQPRLTQHSIEPHRHAANAATPSIASSISIANTTFTCIDNLTLYHYIGLYSLFRTECSKYKKDQTKTTTTTTTEIQTHIKAKIKKHTHKHRNIKAQAHNNIIDHR